MCVRCNAMLLRLLTLFLLAALPVMGQSRREITVTDISGAIYASGWEVEKEVVVRPMTLQDGLGINLGIQDGDVVDGVTRAEWKVSVLSGLSDVLKVWIDGEDDVFEAVGVQFILPDPNEFKPLLMEQEVSVNDFMLTVTWVAPLPKLKSKVEVEWESFPKGVEVVPVRLADTLGTRTVEVQRETGKMDAEIRLAKNLRSAPVKHLVQPQVIDLKKDFVFICIPLTIFIFSIFLWRKRNKIFAGVMFTIAIVTCFVIYPFLGWVNPSVSSIHPSVIVKNVLEGVYYAYQFTDRETQYDAMEQTLTGDALESSFLEAAATMGMREREGSRVRIRSVTVNDAHVSSRDGQTMTVNADWITLGEMGHWGHFHKVKHSHIADIALEQVDGYWKGAGFKLQERHEEK